MHQITSMPRKESAADDKTANLDLPSLIPVRKLIRAIIPPPPPPLPCVSAATDTNRGECK